jgi:hypothetical protein
VISEGKVSINSLIPTDPSSRTVANVTRKDPDKELVKWLTDLQIGKDVIDKVANFFFKKKLPSKILAGFDLTTRSSSLLGGRRRRFR